RTGFAGNAALAAVARLAQGDAEVDQAGCGDQAVGVQRLFGLKAGRDLANRDDPAVGQIEIGELLNADGRVDYPGAKNRDLHQFCSPSSASRWRCAVCPLMAMESTAMRMAMP